MSKKSIWITLLSLLLVFSITIGAVAEESKVNGPGRVAKPGIDNQKYIDINEIEAAIRNNGIFANDVNTGGSGLYYPKGQHNNAVLYTSGLWLLGLIDGDIRSAACQYSSEFQPGYILPDGSAVDATDPAYTIFKYNKGDVIEQAALDQGCPADVIGDQMLYCVYNDLAPHDGVYTKPPIGVEVQQTVWGFNRTGALGKTLFIRYRIINKNVNGDSLKEAYIGVFFDPDLGGANDDAAGCDVELGIGYVYNGTNNDSNYGAGAPAMASDFFQGPIVPAEEGVDAVLPNGRVYPNSKVLDMTAFFTFINGSPITGMGDPTLRAAEGAVEAYWFVKGYRNNGLEWEDPTTGQTTKFPLAGDPTTGTGWLYRHVAPPLDVRMGNASGPFTMAPGDTQDVVVGIVVGDGGELGGDNLASVAVMKYYDAQAQQAYDLNFQLPDPPPTPEFQVSTLDGEIVITWNDEAVSYADAGYVFEGYNVWIADAPAGPFSRMQTYDVANGVTSVWDKEFNVNLSNILEQPVQFGTDTGLKFSYTLTEDPRTRNPLVNGKPYYFAVTAYGVNETGTPKVLETAKNSVEAIPQRPVLDVALNSETAQVVDWELHGPATDSELAITVIDPTKVTGDDYRVNLKANTDDPDNVWYYYELVNTTTGQTLLTEQTNISGDDAYVVVDGLQISVKALTPADYGWSTAGYRGNGWDYTGSRWITGVNWGGHNLFNGMDLGEAFIGASTLGPTDYFNMEVDFWNAASNTADPVAHPWSECVVWDRSNGYASSMGTFPGAAYEMANGERIRRTNIAFVEFALVDGFWDPIAAETGDGTGGREYVFFMTSDYDPTAAMAAYGGAGPFAVAYDCIFAMWVQQRGSHTADEEFTLQMFVNHPFTPDENYFTFSTDGLELAQNAEIAKARLDDINVFPNPYFGHNTAEGTFFSQFVTFNNLPADNCVIRVFTLSGVLVTTLEHNDGTPFEKWYLQNDESLPVASGMYIIHVETEFGNKILKLAVVNRQQRYQHI